MAIESPNRQGAAAGPATPSTPQTSTTFTTSKSSVKRSRSEASEEEDELEESSLSSLSEREESYVPSRAASYEGDDDKDGIVSSKESSPAGDEDDDSPFDSQESSAGSSAAPSPSAGTHPNAIASTPSTDFPFVPKTRGSWSGEKDQLLLRCVRLYRRDWSKVAKAFSKESKTSSRTAGACSHRYKLLLDEINTQQGAIDTVQVRGPPSQASSSSLSAGHAGSPRGPRGFDSRPHQDRASSSSLSPAKRARTHLDFASPAAQAPTAGQAMQPSIGSDKDDSAVDFDVGMNEAAASGHIASASREPKDSDHVAPFFPLRPAAAAWDEEEDEVLYRCVRKEGRDWSAVATSFSKEADDFPPRSPEALEARYGELLQEHEKRMLALQAQESSAQPQREASEAASPPPPRLPTSASTSNRVLVHGGHVWTREEEECLLASALRHEGINNIRKQVQAIFDDFKAFFPATKRPIDAVHIQYRQVLQDHLEKHSRDGNGAAAGDEGQTGEEDEYVERRTEEVTKQIEAVKEVERAAPSSQVALSGSPRKVEQAVRRVHFEDVGPSSSSPSPSPSMEHQESLAPATPPSFNIALKISHASFNNAHAFFNGCGYRFERMPRGSQIAITSPTDFKVFCKEDSHLYRTELQSAAFVFTILRDGSIEGTRCPQNTTSYSVRVFEEDEEQRRMDEDEAEETEEERCGQGSGSEGDGGRSKVLGYETRFFGEDGFWIVFFTPV